MHLERRDYAVAVGLALLVLITGAAVLVPGVTGAFHDDAIYVSTARALAEGDGYRLINLPGAPPQTKYPILYPLTLSLIWRVGSSVPGRIAAMQWLTLISASAALALSFLYLVRFSYATRSVAAGAVALAATAPFLLHVGTLTLSEMPFALALVIAIWRVEAWGARANPTRRSALITGLVIALPSLTRVIGAGILVACLLWLSRRRLKVGYVVLGSATALAPWMLWSFSAAGAWRANEIAGYYTDYTGAWRSVGLPAFAQVVLSNCLWIAHGSVAAWLEGLSRTTMARGISVGPLLALTGVGVWIAVVRESLRGRLLAYCLSLYFGTIIFWPWPPLRFLVPILPFLAMFACRACEQALRKLPTAATVVLGVSAWSIALALNLTAIVSSANVNRIHHFPFYPKPDRPVAWASYGEVFEWLRAHTQPGELIASGLDTMVFTYTDRQAFRPFVHRPDRLFYGTPGAPTGSVDDLVRALRAGRADYLVMMPMFGFAEERSFGDVVARAAAMGTTLTRVFVSADGRFVVFEVNF